MTYVIYSYKCFLANTQLRSEKAGRMSIFCYDANGTRILTNIVVSGWIKQFETEYDIKYQMKLRDFVLIIG